MPENAYYRPVINPPGGASVSSIPLDMGQDYIAEAIDAGVSSYRNKKAQAKQQQLDDAKYAAMLAEAIGGYTPELQERVMAPTGEQATLGEKAIGGLGRMIGLDTRMGEGKAPIYVPPGGLKTQYERDIEKSQREAGTKYNEFLRDLFKEQFKGDVEYQQKLKEKEAGITVPRLTYEQQLQLAKEKAAADKGGKMTAREQLAWDLYNGDIAVEDLDTADLMIMGKYWNNMTPESRSKDALKYAQSMVEAMEKGSLDTMSDVDRGAMVDKLAQEFIDKQDAIIGRFRGKQPSAGQKAGGMGGGKRRPRKGQGYEERDEQGRRTLDSLFGGAY